MIVIFKSAFAQRFIIGFLLGAIALLSASGVQL